MPKPKQPTDAQIFVPAVATPTGNWPARKLTLGGSIQFTQLVADIFAESQPVLQEFVSGGSISNLVALLFQVLNEERLYTLLELATGHDRAWIDQHFDPVDAMDCLTDFFVGNRLVDMNRAVRGLAGSALTLLPRKTPTEPTEPSAG